MKRKGSLTTSITEISSEGRNKSCGKMGWTTLVSGLRKIE
jgi:hypothetical protein